jgi:hypothetical protein
MFANVKDPLQRFVCFFGEKSPKGDSASKLWQKRSVFIKTNREN